MYKKILSFDVGIRNLGLTLVEYNFENEPNLSSSYPWNKFKITKLELIDMVEEVCQGKKQRAGCKPKTAKNINIHTICQGLVNILFKRLSYLDGITNIMVEQQLILRGKSSMGSARMKVIQHCILTFYETYYALNSSLHKPSITPASPANKLKCIIDEKNFATTPLFTTDKNTDYKQRKDKAVEGFLKFIPWCNIDENLKLMFTDIKKQNDLADCVLQALYELQLYGSSLLKKSNDKMTPEEEKEINITPTKAPRKRKTTSQPQESKMTPEEEKETNITPTKAPRKRKTTSQTQESKMTPEEK
jgi:hypothetical protein